MRIVILTLIVIGGSLLPLGQGVRAQAVIGSDRCPENLQEVSRTGYRLASLDVRGYCERTRRPQARYDSRHEWWFCGPNIAVRYGIACRDQYDGEFRVKDYCFQVNPDDRDDRSRVWCEIRPR